ncbi:MAG: uridine kinase [Bacteroidetes bacterium]|nr:uridine kinase [Bacteroidota bacterium]
MYTNEKPLVIGIFGGSGSGKTTLLRRLSEIFSCHDPSIFSMDNYYRPIEEQFKDENNVVNFDLPTALQGDKLVEDLKSLLKGKEIVVKEYYFNSPPDKNVLLTIRPSRVIIVEGLFLFHFREIPSFLNFSIFVEVDHSIQLDRRLYRDQETRGYRRDDILYQWHNHVLPCYEKYIFPYRNKADFIFQNDHRSEIEFARLNEKLKRFFE